MKSAGLLAAVTVALLGLAPALSPAAPRPGPALASYLPASLLDAAEQIEGGALGPGGTSGGPEARPASGSGGVRRVVGPEPGDPVGGDIRIDDLYPPDLDPAESDPFEETNRGIFGFNRKVERHVLDPVSDAYQWLLPDPARDAVYRAFRNLHSTSVFVNDVLQIEPKRAGVTGARFVINTTAGIAGFFDTARRLGLQAHHADFGQTLGRAGVPSGPYLVLPLFGPSTARDAFGDLVDGLFLPQFYVLGPGSNVVLAAGSGLSTHDANAESLRTLRETSIDFYAALRSAYLMHRHEVIRDPYVAGPTTALAP